MEGGYIGAPACRAAERGESLGGREEVPRLIPLGYGSKDVAARPDVSSEMGEAHKGDGMVKPGLGTRMDIVSYAIFRGWMPRRPRARRF